MEKISIEKTDAGTADCINVEVLALALAVVHNVKLKGIKFSSMVVADGVVVLRGMLPYKGGLLPVKATIKPDEGTLTLEGKATKESQEFVESLIKDMY